MATSKSTSFWARDEDFGRRMDEVYSEGEHFLCMNIAPDTPFTDPNNGKVYDSRTKMTTRALDPTTLQPMGLPVEVKTLAGPIYDRAKESTEGFPAVVCWRRVPVKQFGNEATILEKVSDWPLPDEVRAMMAGDVPNE